MGEFRRDDEEMDGLLEGGERVERWMVAGGKRTERTQGLLLAVHGGVMEACEYEDNNDENEDEDKEKESKNDWRAKEMEKKKGSRKREGR